MDPRIQEFVQGKCFALVGVSRSGKKFGNAIYTELKQRGYELLVVHPELKEYDGAKCYSNLSELMGKVDGVIICVPARQAGQVIKDASQAGIKHIWLQMGADSPEVLAFTREQKIDVIAKKCILMYAQPVKGLHGFHRTVNRIIGQL